MYDTSIKLVNNLSPELIVSDLRSANRDKVIRELARVLAKHHEGLDESDVADVLLERERQGSTAIGEGIAVPHAKLASMDRIVACFGRSIRGVDFDSQDGKPCHFFFVVMSPIDSTGSHLKLLARFSQLFKDSEFRSDLMDADSAQDLYTLIAQQDAR